MNPPVRHLKGLALVACALSLTACQTITTKKDTENFQKEFAVGNYQQAADSALKAGSITAEGESTELLWALHAGAALSASGQYDFSNKVLDGAETLMKAEDTEHVARKGIETVTSVLLNNTFNRYSPAVYDGVMVNTYKALNSIYLHDFQNARIELNRAADRQRRAEEYFKERLSEQKEELAKKEQELQQTKKQNSDNKAAPEFDFAQKQKDGEKSVYDAYPELAEWQVYPDFVNPYTDYLHGLYFMLASEDKGDLGKARQSMRRVAGMTPNNSAVKTDLKVIDKLRKGQWRKSRLKPTVWVIFENGEAPEVAETLIPIPLFIVSDKLEYSQLALPKLKDRKRAYPSLTLYSGKKKLGETSLLASMDRVVQSEFKKEFPLKVTKAVASTVVKGFVQYQARKEGGAIGSVLAGIYQLATTHADTRSWTELPKEIQVARISKPKSSKLQLKADGLAEPLDIDLPDNQFSIIYVKASAPGSKPVYRVAGFDA